MCFRCPIALPKLLAYNINVFITICEFFMQMNVLSHLYICASTLLEFPIKYNHSDWMEEYELLILGCKLKQKYSISVEYRLIIGKCSNQLTLKKSIYKRVL